MGKKTNTSEKWGKIAGDPSKSRVEKSRGVAERPARPATSYTTRKVVVKAATKKAGAATPPPEKEAKNVCFNCKKPGHFSRECKEPKKETRTCFKCQEEGHLAKDCTNPRKAPKPPSHAQEAEEKWKKRLVEIRRGSGINALTLKYNSPEYKMLGLGKCWTLLSGSWRRSSRPDVQHGLDREMRFKKERYTVGVTRDEGVFLSLLIRHYTHFNVYMGMQFFKKLMVYLPHQMVPQHQQRLPSYNSLVRRLEVGGDESENDDDLYDDWGNYIGYNRRRIVHAPPAVDMARYGHMPKVNVTPETLSEALEQMAKGIQVDLLQCALDSIRSSQGRKEVIHMSSKLLTLDSSHSYNVGRGRDQTSIRRGNWQQGAWIDVIRVLLETGCADPNVTQNEYSGKTALDLALEFRRLDIFELLLEFGASPGKAAQHRGYHHYLYMYGHTHWTEGSSLIQKVMAPFREINSHTWTENAQKMWVKENVPRIRRQLIALIDNGLATECKHLIFDLYQSAIFRRWRSGCYEKPTQRPEEFRLRNDNFDDDLLQLDDEEPGRRVPLCLLTPKVRQPTSTHPPTAGGGRPRGGSRHPVDDGFSLGCCEPLQRIALDLTKWLMAELVKRGANVNEKITDDSHPAKDVNVMDLAYAHRRKFPELNELFYFVRDELHGVPMRPSGLGKFRLLGHLNSHGYDNKHDHRHSHKK